jgi:hypothetical protein
MLLAAPPTADIDGIDYSYQYLGMLALIASVAAIMLLVSAWAEVDASTRKKRLLRAAAAVSAVVSVFAWIQASAGNAAGEKAISSYRSSVTSWLANDYGIDVGPAQLEGLFQGDSYTATYDGEPITISIRDTVDGQLSVIDEKSTPLTPLESK